MAPTISKLTLPRYAALAAILAACSAGDGSSGLEGGTQDDPTGGEGAADPNFTGGDNPSGGTNECVPSGADFDGDGFMVEDGDCNDCDPNVNPGAVEVKTDPDDPDAQQADENCDGAVDEPQGACDDGMTVGEGDAMRAAEAIGLCKVAGADDWGVLSAAYVRANGTPTTANLQVGLLDSFGTNVAPREGATMVALSSGRARLPGDADVCTSQSCTEVGLGTAPTGFPQDTPSCTGDTEINDDVALEVTLRAPTNATGYTFDFDFYSNEYPEWVCTSYNDQFIALVSPEPEGSINGNISFDSQTNPVSINIALFDVCDPSTGSSCALGTDELLGTGFDTWGYDGLKDAGATGWLVTTAPVDAGSEVTIRFAIWDTGDTAYDSTVLIDNFQWLADGGSVDVGTTPVVK